MRHLGPVEQLEVLCKVKDVSGISIQLCAQLVLCSRTFTMSASVSSYLTRRKQLRCVLECRGILVETGTVHLINLSIEQSRCAPYALA
jgi:hypothetical protein